MPSGESGKGEVVGVCSVHKDILRAECFCLVGWRKVFLGAKLLLWISVCVFCVPNGKDRGVIVAAVDVGCR